MLVSLVVVGLFVAGWQLGHGIVSASLIIPLPAAGLAGLTVVVSLVAYFWAPKRLLFWMALAAYLLLAATTGLVIGSTGLTNSPFLALWMMLAIFSGLFGIWGLGPIFLATNGVLIYNMVSPHGVGREQLLLFLLACELPLFISYLLWHNKNTHENEKERAFNALAQELNQVANKSEIVINAIADGVLALNEQGTIQLINPAAQTIVGWSKQDAMGLDYHSLLKLSDQKGTELTPETDPIQQVLHGHSSVLNNDLLLTMQSGKQIILSLLVSPISSKPGAGVIVVFRDITKEKKEEHQQVEFISTASHEMRTPVAAIEGYLGLALNPSTAAIDDKARLYLQKAHESAQHLGRLFQDLLDVSKAEDGRLKNNPAVVDMVAFARDVTTSFEPKAKEKGLFLYFKPGDGSDTNRVVSPVFYSKVDNDHLREVLSNLIENAIKYTKTGSVTVDVKGDPTHTIISVSDTGIGIPPEDLPHLFQKFYRVDNSDTREIGGTGLGLYLCRRLAEAMGGRVWATSEMGKGSTFNFEAPRMTHEEAVNELEKEQEPTQTITPSPQRTPLAQPIPAQPQPQPAAASPAAPVVAAVPAPAVAPQPVADPMLRPTASAPRPAQIIVPNRSGGIGTAAKI
ncbi:MAG TPA: ATP-binding protein [Candidatus Saccharimonadales bacterium]|jgi:PAS domain S-box-containing protein|nr:ATP-binding protein [Candidatus Saccharimonadales bacterium]